MAYNYLVRHLPLTSSPKPINKPTGRPSPSSQTPHESSPRLQADGCSGPDPEPVSAASAAASMADSLADDFANLSVNGTYGCVYLCGHTFSTLKRWRIHDQARHYQNETWRCAVPTYDGGPECGITFYSTPDFETHLQSAHGIENKDESTAWIQAGHIHANCQVNFWCGFCRGIVPLEERGMEAWTERLDHLQAHFDNGDSLANAWLKLK